LTPLPDTSVSAPTTVCVKVPLCQLAATRLSTATAAARAADTRSVRTCQGGVNDGVDAPPEFLPADEEGDEDEEEDECEWDGDGAASSLGLSSPLPS